MIHLHNEQLFLTILTKDNFSPQIGTFYHMVYKEETSFNHINARIPVYLYKKVHGQERKPINDNI